MGFLPASNYGQKDALLVQAVPCCRAKVGFQWSVGSDLHRPGPVGKSLGCGPMDDILWEGGGTNPVTTVPRRRSHWCRFLGRSIQRRVQHHWHAWIATWYHLQNFSHWKSRMTLWWKWARGSLYGPKQRVRTWSAWCTRSHNLGESLLISVTL